MKVFAAFAVRGVAVSIISVAATMSAMKFLPAQVSSTPPPPIVERSDNGVISIPVGTPAFVRCERSGTIPIRIPADSNASVIVYLFGPEFMERLVRHLTGEAFSWGDNFYVSPRYVQEGYVAGFQNLSRGKWYYMTSSDHDLMLDCANMGLQAFPPGTVSSSRSSARTSASTAVSSATSRAASSSARCPMANCIAPPAGCIYQPDTTDTNGDGCPDNLCGRLLCASSAPASSARQCPVAECLAPPAGCVYQPDPRDANGDGCPDNLCGTIQCSNVQSSSRSSVRPSSSASSSANTLSSNAANTAYRVKETSLRLASNNNGEAVLLDTRSYPEKPMTMWWFDGTSWSAPRTIGSGGGPSSHVQLHAVSLSTGGDVTAVYTYTDAFYKDSLRVMRWNANDANTAPREVAIKGLNTDPIAKTGFASDDNGNIALHLTTVNYALMSNDGTRGFTHYLLSIDATDAAADRVQTLTPPSGRRYQDFSIAMGKYGHAMVTWFDIHPASDTTILRAMFASAPGQWSAAMDLASSNQSNFTMSPKMAINIYGTVTMAYKFGNQPCVNSQGQSFTSSLTVQRYENGQWRRIDNCLQEITDGMANSVAVDSQGSVLLTFSKNGKIYSRHYDATSVAPTWSTAFELEGAQPDTYEFEQPYVFMGASGKAAVIYTLAARLSLQEVPHGVYGAIFTRGSGWTQPFTLDAPVGSITVNPTIGVAPARTWGEFRFLWSRGLQSSNEMIQPQSKAY